MWYLGQKPWCDVSTRKRTCRAVVIQSPLGVRLSPDLYRQVVASIWIDRVRKDLPNRVVPRMSGSNHQISRLFRAHFRPRGGCFACRFLSWVKAWRRLFPTYVFCLCRRLLALLSHHSCFVTLLLAGLIANQKATSQRHRKA